MRRPEGTSRRSGSFERHSKPAMRQMWVSHRVGIALRVGNARLSQKVLQFQSRGMLLLMVAFVASGFSGPPLARPNIGITGVVVAMELALLLRERRATSHEQYRFQQCLQAREGVPSGWNSASWSRGIMKCEWLLQKT